MPKTQARIIVPGCATGSFPPFRHCEERSDAAIHEAVQFPGGEVIHKAAWIATALRASQ
jgi:hypothetical protein